MSLISFDLKKYKTLVFDCDGVILNSNSVKTNAFYTVARPFGESAAKMLLEYHINHGGVSRYKKIDYFQREVLKQSLNYDDQKKLLAVYAEEVKIGLYNCEITNNLEKLRESTSDTKWLVVSGGDQSELRELFSFRKIDHLFNGGIFGSPDDKDTILSRELCAANIIKPAVYFGDTKYDYEVATRGGLDFIYVYRWSEYLSCGSEIQSLLNISQLSDLL